MINKMLVIDDDELTTYLVKKMVRSSNLVNDLLTKENGQEAIEYLHSLENKDEFPDVIIVDIDMPVMDGYEFVDAYQNAFWKKYPNTHIMMFTSSKRKSDLEKSLSYECVSECVNKPMTQEMLSQISSKVA